MTSPKGYWIGHVTVTHPERYPEYQAANAKALEKYGAKFLVRGGRFEAVEGEVRERHVIVEFESYQAALDCYYSPEYQEALKIRQAISDAQIIVIEGYVAP